MPVRQQGRLFILNWHKGAPCWQSCWKCELFQLSSRESSTHQSISLFLSPFPPFFFLCVCVCVCVFRLTSHDLLIVSHNKVQHVYTTKLEVGMLSESGCKYLMRNDVWFNPVSRRGLYKNQRLAQSAQSLNPEGSPAALPTSTPSLTEALSPSLSTWPTVPSMKLAKDLGTCGSSKVWVWLCLLSDANYACFILTQESRMEFSSVHVPFLTRGQSPRSWFWGEIPYFAVVSCYSISMPFLSIWKTQFLPLGRLIGSD